MKWSLMRTSQVELIQQAKARYVLALEAILDDDKVQVEDPEEPGLQARLDRILTQLQSIEFRARKHLASRRNRCL